MVFFALSIFADWHIHRTMLWEVSLKNFSSVKFEIKRFFKISLLPVSYGGLMFSELYPYFRCFAYPFRDNCSNFNQCLLKKILWKFSLFFFFSKKMASNMSIWPIWSNLTGIADIKKLLIQSLFTQVRTNWSSSSSKSFIELNFLRSFTIPIFIKIALISFNILMLSFA